jgi:hypothetical protein
LQQYTQLEIYDVCKKLGPNNPVDPELTKIIEKSPEILSKQLIFDSVDEILKSDTSDLIEKFQTKSNMDYYNDKPFIERIKNPAIKEAWKQVFGEREFKNVGYKYINQ